MTVRYVVLKFDSENDPVFGTFFVATTSLSPMGGSKATCPRSSKPC